eukprot:90939_1
MEQLLRFRSGMDRLSDKEFTTFIQTIDRKSICALIFNGFRYGLQCIQRLDEIDNIMLSSQQLNQKISQIIASRQRNKTKSEEEDEEVIVDKIDKLPLVMISEISSFLKYESMINFELCNRTIFIGTRSPISLHSVPQNPFNKYIKFCAQNDYQYYWKMHRFRACKEMSLLVESCFTYNSDGDQIYAQYLLSNLTNAHWKNIRTLIINGGFDRKEYINETMFWMQFFQVLRTCNTSNISHVYAHGPNERNAYVYCPLVFDYVPSIEYAALDQSLSRNTLAKIEWPSMLKGVRMPFMRTDHGTLADDQDGWRFSNELQSFHCSWGVPQQMIAKLHNLREICLTHRKSSSPYEHPIDALNSLVNAKHGLSQLQRIHYSDETIQRHSLETNEDRRRTLLKLWRINTLNYISVNGNCSVNKFKRLFGTLCEALTNDDDNSMKQRLKVKMSCQRNVTDATFFTECIVKLLDVLRCNVVQFMLIGEMKFRDDFNVKSRLDLLREQYRIEIYEPKPMIKYWNSEDDGKFNYWKFVISNKSCTVNGYNENWLMGCQTCSSEPYEDYGRRTRRY